MLLQDHEGTRFPIAYASKKLSPSEKSYSVIEKECLAIVWAMKKFELYLFGVDFVVETDHRPLAYLNEAKFVNSRIMRWALFLQNFRFIVHAIRGKANVIADYLSQMGEESSPEMDAQV